MTLSLLIIACYSSWRDPLSQLVITSARSTILDRSQGIFSTVFDRPTRGTTNENSKFCLRDIYQFSIPFTSNTCVFKNR
ncbi:hypothetical protein L596_005049 [Steinernema carpocapsae]|uniref:Uncharacterized protein n=1 Tax=Steinernema carpocapsae TaxID=34508 RepID=A0A4U8V1Z2_STECR|nr:hypothetical protein L596_005049 [Steinernema carpocapsae]